MIGEAEKKSWMALNTFRCPHLRADLSPESCKRNRQKPRLIFGYLPERFQPVPCSDCADWPALCRQVELRRAGASEEDAMEKAIKVCRECGKVKKIVGRRLCGACYMRLKKSGRLDQEYPLAPREARQVAKKQAFLACGRECGLWNECRGLPGEEIPENCPAMLGGKSAAGDPATAGGEPETSVEAGAGGGAAPGSDALVGDAAALAEGGPEKQGQDISDPLVLDLSIVPGLREYLEGSASENMRSTVEREALFILRAFMREHPLRDEFIPPFGTGRVMPLHTR